MIISIPFVINELFIPRKIVIVLIITLSLHLSHFLISPINRQLNSWWNQILEPGLDDENLSKKIEFIL